MLPDELDAIILICRVARIAVLQGEPVAVVHVILLDGIRRWLATSVRVTESGMTYAAIGGIVTELTPEGVTSNRWTLLDDLKHRLQVGRIPAYPVVLPSKERSSGGFDESNVLMELSYVHGIHVIGEDVDLFDA